jgi:predicted TIM-barrel fold metal-dependent hydrolase
MIVDCDRHVGVSSYADLFPHMTLAWQKHFERDEFLLSIADGSSHIRLSERFTYDAPEEAAVDDPDDLIWLAIPHQGLTINGWADRIAAKTFVEALNSYGEEHWSASPRARRATLVSPHDVQWSAGEIRRRAASDGVAAVALPLPPVLLGSEAYDPIYDACSEVGLPLVIHFSGVEGRYLGAPPLGGGVHYSAFARDVLMPQLAESNITSMLFEGTFEKFPDLRVLFVGFGFTWLTSLLWRLDREWRTFRHDVPWVKRPPSGYVFDNVWLTTWPVDEAVDAGVWEKFGFPDQLVDRVVYGSHAPFDGDSPADVVRVLGSERSGKLLTNGLALVAPGVASTV